MLKQRCVSSALPRGLSARYRDCIYFLNRFKQSLSEMPTGRMWNLLTSCLLHARASSLALPCQVSTQTTSTTISYFSCNSCWYFGRIYLLQPYPQHPHNLRGIVVALKTVDRKGGCQKQFPRHYCLYYTTYRHFGGVKNISAFKQLSSSGITRISFAFQVCFSGLNEKNKQIQHFNRVGVLGSSRKTD